MTKAEFAIQDAKELLASDRARYAGEVRINALSSAIAVAEASRAGLADVKNRLMQAALCVEKLLEDGLGDLPGHSIRDEQYSKITTAAHAARFRQAMALLRNERDKMDLAIADHLRAIRTVRV